MPATEWGRGVHGASKQCLRRESTPYWRDDRGRLACCRVTQGPACGARRLRPTTRGATLAGRASQPRGTPQRLEPHPPPARVEAAASGSRCGKSPGRRSVVIRLDGLDSVWVAQRIANPSEIAAAIVYLLADATFNTGVTLSTAAASQSPEVIDSAGDTVPSSLSARSGPPAARLQRDAALSGYRRCCVLSAPR